MSGSRPWASARSRNTAVIRVSRSVPDRISPIAQRLSELHDRYLDDRDGHVATCIPEVSLVPPDQFGIAVVTADGHVYEMGDSREAFTIAS